MVHGRFTLVGCHDHHGGLLRAY